MNSDSSVQSPNARNRDRSFDLVRWGSVIGGGAPMCSIIPLTLSRPRPRLPARLDTCSLRGSGAYLPVHGALPARGPCLRGPLARDDHPHRDC